MRGLIASAVAAAYFGISSLALAEQITVKAYNISGPYSFDGNRMSITMNDGGGNVAIMRCEGQQSSKASEIIKYGSVIVLDSRKRDGPFVGCLDVISIDGKLFQQ